MSIVDIMASGNFISCYGVKGFLVLLNSKLSTYFERKMVEKEHKSFVKCVVVSKFWKLQFLRLPLLSALILTRDVVFFVLYYIYSPLSQEAPLL